MSNTPANFGYTFGFSSEGSRADDLFVANEVLLAYTDGDLYSMSHEELDDLGVALVVDSEGGPSGCDSRDQLDWHVLTTSIGVQGPEPIALTDVKLGLDLVARQNMYANCLQTALYFKKCAAK